MKTRHWYRNKKHGYISHTSQDVTLKSGYTTFQTRKGLSKAWVGYTIAKNRGEHDKLKYYASVILLDAGITSQQYLAKFPHRDIDEK